MSKHGKLVAFLLGGLYVAPPISVRAAVTTHRHCDTGNEERSHHGDPQVPLERLQEAQQVELGFLFGHDDDEPEVQVGLGEIHHLLPLKRDGHGR